MILPDTESPKTGLPNWKIFLFLKILDYLWTTCVHVIKNNAVSLVVSHALVGTESFTGICES